MLNALLKPIRIAIEGVGTGLARMGLIDGERALRVSNLAWPRIVTGLARMSKATADVAMVGSALGAAAIAGVGYAIPYWGLSFMIGGGIAGGTISLVSQRYAAGRHRASSTAIKMSVVFSIAVMIPLVATFWLTPGPLIRLLGAEGDVLRYGVEYLRLVSLGMPFTAVNLVASRALIGANDAWTPMIVRAGGAVANVVLNALFIFVFEMGVAGAALGTVIVGVASTAVFAVGLTRGALPFIGRLPIRIDWSRPHWNGRTARHLAEISTPLALTNMAQNGGQFPMLIVVSLFGPEVVAAFVVALRVRDLLNTPGWGFGLASSSLVGQALGVDCEEDAGGYARDALRYAVAVYAIGAVAVFVFAHPITFLFVDDPAIVPVATGLVRATCVSVVLWGVMNGALGPLRASGDTRWPLYGQLLGLLAFAVPAAYLGAVTPLGLTGLYLALILETAVPAAVTYYRYQSETWKVVSRTYRHAA